MVFLGLPAATPPPTYNAYQSGAPPDQHGRDYASETSSYSDGGGGGYGGYRNDASSPYSNETSDHSGEMDMVDESWTVKELRYECWRNGLRNFTRPNKGALIRLLNRGVLMG